MNRRTFLKLTGMGSIAFAAGCSDYPERHLYSLVQEREEMVTGVATWYATTCRECPAGCGVLAKNREGRAIKLEGHPGHPVNQGKLCARGQAALQALYHPERIRHPLLKENEGWREISSAQAQMVIRRQITQAAERGPNRVGMLTETVGQPILRLFETVLAQSRSEGPLVFEPLAFEALKFAHEQLFGSPMLPSYRLEQADLMVGMGADFLETWLSPVEYARKFKSMHALRDGRKGRFVQISPFQSLTGLNADEWIACRPGGEAVVVMGLLHRVIAGGGGLELPEDYLAGLRRLAQPYSPARVQEATDVPAATIEKLGALLVSARRPLVLPTATAPAGHASAAADLASVLLNAVLDPAFGHYDFEQRHRIEIAHSRAAVQRWWQLPDSGPLDVLLLNNVNPRLHLGAAADDRRAGYSPFTVAFSNFMDETTSAAHLIVPTQLPLESWDLYESKQGIVSALQPVAGRLTSAAHIGDLFLELLAPSHRSASDYRQYLLKELSAVERIDTEKGWMRLFQNGGRFPSAHKSGANPARWNAATLDTLEKLLAGLPTHSGNRSVLLVTPSLRIYDGRNANRPWLPEIPEPVSHVAWQTPLLVASQTMSVKGLSDGDLVRVETAAGGLEAPVVAYAGLHPSALVMTMGQGRAQIAPGRGLDPLPLLGTTPDPNSGAPDFSVELARMERGKGRIALARTSGSRDPHDRKIALSVPLSEATAAPPPDSGLAMWDFPFTPPLPQSYDRRRDIYPPLVYDQYRWGMVVDLDRCTGCSACVVACQAENNIGMVGEEQVVRGREMAWIRIEHYADLNDPARTIFLPMLCQHCDNAPCESVCPVYAPHHSREGLNNQIYNRCIGTRFCGQNCPYKVRRFNWFEWQWPAPLDQQLNPDVTVRSKGVMEKCSFCVQRIKEARNEAMNQDRAIRDGEVIPACVQTCPTSAIHFGNLMDPDSVVGKLMSDPRAYQVLGYLNTKPAVIYLKKVVQAV
jgi:anaerobic selenocysteine-containing dehydrogenase/Fe-S-cluster-containing dehydrogenase component